MQRDEGSPEQRAARRNIAERVSRKFGRAQCYTNDAHPEASKKALTSYLSLDYHKFATVTNAEMVVYFI